MQRGADIAARVLSERGPDTLFAMSGNQLMPLFDALIDTPQRLVHVRHEAAAVHMADAWCRMTGRPGIALVPAGPGFANALSALYTARQSDSALVMISAQAPLAQTGMGAFQEMPQADIAKPFTKHSISVASQQEIGPAICQALAIAGEGRPGPVHLAVPSDLLSATAPACVVDTAQEPRASKPDIRPLADALRSSSNSLILAGPLFGQPGLQLDLAIAEQAIGVPVIVMESPRGLADPAAGALSELLGQVDLAVLLGKRADHGVGFGNAFAAKTRFVVVDEDREALDLAAANLGSDLESAFACDPRAMLQALVAGLDQPHAAVGWRQRVRKAIAYRPAAWRNEVDDANGIHPAGLCRAIEPILAKYPNAILVCDGGEFGQWVQACLSPMRRIINGPAGAIGSALPFAIAAKLADPDAPVLAFLGDGTAGFHLAEFETAARCQVPIVAIIGNDARWNAEHQIQLRDYGAERLHGCDLTPARYDLAARALGCHGRHVERLADVSPALETALASKQPVCIDVRLNGQPAPVVWQTSP